MSFSASKNIVFMFIIDFQIDSMFFVIELLKNYS